MTRLEPGAVLPARDCPTGPSKPAVFILVISTWHDIVSSQPEDTQLVWVRRNPGDFVRPWRSTGTLPTPGSSAARRHGLYRGSSSLTGKCWPPRLAGRVPPAQPHRGRTSTCVRRPMGRRSGCAARAKTLPLFGPCSTARAWYLHWPAAGNSTGMRPSSGEPARARLAPACPPRGQRSIAGGPRRRKRTMRRAGTAR